MKNKLCHDIVETMLKLALNANQSINKKIFNLSLKLFKIQNCRPLYNKLK